MADSIVALITQDIITTLHGEEIEYGNDTHTITCEQQRTIKCINNRYPFVELIGPMVEVNGRAHKVITCECNYIIEVYIPANDQDDLTSDPITKITQNIHADIIKLLMDDITRGGYAKHTAFNSFGQYFTSDYGSPEYVVYLECMVKTQLNEFDPYILGGL